MKGKIGQPRLIDGTRADKSEIVNLLIYVTIVTKEYEEPFSRLLTK